VALADLIGAMSSTQKSTRRTSAPPSPPARQAYKNPRDNAAWRAKLLADKLRVRVLVEYGFYE
jgi:hypothetical protein